MIKTSNIKALYLTQKNILNIIKDSDEMRDTSNTIAVLGIIELYDKLENEVRFFIKEAESNAYYYGFKAGLQIAVESGLHTD